MSKIHLLAAVLVASFFFVDTAEADASEWEDLGVKDGVQLHFKEVGDDFSARGEIVVDVHIGKLLRVFTNPNERANWVGNYVDHKTLDITRTSERYWLKLDPSRLVSARDYVIDARYTFDEENRTFRSVAQSVDDERMPDQDCCQRAVSNTTYTFEALPGQERTRIHVEVSTDPKGRIPRRSVRSAVQDWPVNTLNALVRRASIDAMPVDPRVKDWHEAR